MNTDFDPYADVPEVIRHAVVRASAGSGKTYQLTTRYLALLGRHEAPRHILATTFTRKAAGEVLARVLGRLTDACTDDRARQQLAVAIDLPLTRGDCVRMLRELTRQLNRLAIGTIDGFFNRAARAMSLELDLPPEPRIIDESSPVAKQLRIDAIQRLLGEQVAQDEGLITLIEMLRRLHHDQAERSVTDALDDIARDLGEMFRMVPDVSLWNCLPVAGRLTGDRLSSAIDRLDAMSEDMPLNKAGKVYTRFATAYQLLLADAKLGRWESVSSNGLVIKVRDGEPTYSSAPISEAWRDAIEPLADHAKADQLQALADQTLATHRLMQAFDHQYTRLRSEHRLMLFSDLTYLLANKLPHLGEAGIDELAYRLDERVTHLLLDEFQDTSLQQWRVLEPFADQVASVSDGSRSLFCVGDTKQAIYRWRGGCAELFGEVESLPGVEVRTLARSWRSSQVVLDAVNAVFSGLSNNAALDQAADAADAWQQGFEQHEAVQADLPGHVILKTTAQANDSLDDADEDAADDDEQLTGSAPPDAHAWAVAEHVKSLTQQIPGRSIGVLMRTRSNAQSIIDALRSLSVPVAEEGGNPIAHVPAVAAVLSTIRWADHPGDRVARFHAQNSPLAEVLGLTESTTTRQALAVARGVRRQLLDRGYASVISSWVRELAWSCDAASLRKLEQLVALAEAHDEYDASLRPSFFVQAVQAARVEDASSAAVRVMTIHGSKGLEFDAVVLPDLDGLLSRQDHRAKLLLDRDSPIDPVRAVLRRPSKDVAKLMPEIEQAMQRSATESRIEDLCLLYVAMTRARQALHLLVKPLKPKKKLDAETKRYEPNAAGLTNLSYAAVLRQSLSEVSDEGFDGDQVLYESGDASWYGLADGSEPSASEHAVAAAPITIRLARSGSGASRSWMRTTPSELASAGTVRAEDLLRRSPGGGRAYGTMMHAMFEQVGFIDEEGVPDSTSLRAVAQRHAGSELNPDAAVDAVHRTLREPAISKLLSRGDASALWRERPFVTRIDHRLVRGTFDRVHLWQADGKTQRALLIDYKTDRVDDDSIDNIVERYADQLRLYREALCSMLKIDPQRVESKLCFVGDARIAQVH